MNVGFREANGEFVYIFFTGDVSEGWSFSLGPVYDFSTGMMMPWAANDG